MLLIKDARRVGKLTIEEEFLWAIWDEITADTIKLLLKSKKAAGNTLHRNLMRIFRLNMLIGGMPQAVETYMEHNNLQAADEAKKAICLKDI